MNEWRRNSFRPRRNPESKYAEMDWMLRIYNGDAPAVVVYGRTELEVATRVEIIVAALGRNDAIPDGERPCP